MLGQGSSGGRRRREGLELEMEIRGGGAGGGGAGGGRKTGEEEDDQRKVKRV